MPSTYQQRLNVRARNRTAVREAKDKPCEDCGIRYPHYVMDFDHRPGTVKLFALGSVNSSARTRRMEDILNEIAKCDLVCANCHRERTHRRGQYAE